MKFFQYLKKDRLIKESIVFLFLLFVLISVFIGIGFNEFHGLYYTNEQESILHTVEPLLHDYHEVATSVESFINESDTVTYDEYLNYCTSICNVEGIESVLYAPQGKIDYVYPTSAETTYKGIDLLAEYEGAELSKFYDAEANGTMFITYPNDQTMIFNKPIKDGSTFIGIVSVVVNTDQFLASLPSSVDVEQSVFYNQDNYYLIGDETYNLSNYNVQTIDIDGVNFYVGTDYYSSYHHTLIMLVFVFEIGIALMLSTMFFLLYRNQKSVIDFMDHVEYTVHYSLETDLKNKTSLYQDFEVFKGTGSIFYLAYGQFNNIKFINYKYGHEMGANVVKAAISLIKGVLRQNTEIYHLGGDEYVFIFNIDNENEVKNILHRVLRVFERDIVIKKIRTNISLSLGVVKHPQEGTTIDELIRNAHLTLFQSKIVNTNDFVFYNSSAITDMISNVNFDNYVSQLNLDLFQLYLMPIVDCKTNKIQGFECLSRAFNEFEEMIDTGSVVSSLERSGRIQELDELVFRKMLIYMKKINTIFPDNDMFLSVNASALSFNEKYVETVIRDYKQFGIKQGTIVLELTESYKVEDHDYLIRLFKQLNEAGIRTAIDDFGSGYSSLSYISKFPIYSIKVDKMYVRDYFKNNFNRTLFLTLRGIAEVLDCKIIAEGVDDPDTLDFLRENECDLYQGFLYSKGVPFEQALNMYKAQKE